MVQAVPPKNNQGFDHRQIPAIASSLCDQLVDLAASTRGCGWAPSLKDWIQLTSIRILLFATRFGDEQWWTEFDVVEI